MPHTLAPAIHTALYGPTAPFGPHGR